MDLQDISHDLPGPPSGSVGPPSGSVGPPSESVGRFASTSVGDRTYRQTGKGMKEGPVSGERRTDLSTDRSD